MLTIMSPIYTGFVDIHLCLWFRGHRTAGASGASIGKALFKVTLRLLHYLHLIQGKHK